MSEDGPTGHTTITLELAGEQYTLRTDADEAYARRCAALVNERMQEIGGDPAPFAKKAAIMAALSLADELFKQEAGVRSRSRAMVERIEAAIED
ncbi:MAG: cell division protein ZapA [Gemmatimonadetes bacterium]|nr:cell division protein ZapA [Gemmatimonadota bacterium]